MENKRDIPKPTTNTNTTKKNHIIWRNNPTFKIPTIEEIEEAMEETTLGYLPKEME